MIKTTPKDKLVLDLRISQIDYDEQRKESMRRDIAKKYDIPLKNVVINVLPIAVDEEGKNLSLAAETIKNIQNPEFQQILFQRYLKINKINDVNIDDIYDIDRQINDFVDFDSYSKYKSYKFKYVKWDNYLSYGKGNYFDFTKLNGLVLLNGLPENQCGKTTFAIDLLRFALFGKAQKSPTLDSVFNIYLPKETEVMVEACVEIEGVDYVIRRTITRPELKKRTKKSKSKQRLEYFRLTNGEYELIDNCEGESTTETNNIIKETIGSVEDFNLVISATAYTLGDLLRMGQADKGRLFSRWLGLLTIEKKEEVAKSMWKKNISPKLLSNTYNKSQMNEECEEINAKILAYKSAMDTSNKKLKETSEAIEGNIKKRNETIALRRYIKEEISGIDVTTVENNLKNEEGLLSIKRSQMREMKAKYAGVKEAKFDEEEYDSLKKEIESVKNENKSFEIKNAEIKVKIKSLRENISNINKLIGDGRCPHCGQTVNIGEQNGHIADINNNITSLINEGVSNKKCIEDGVARLGKLEDKIKLMEEERSKIKEKGELELKMVAVKSNIDSIKMKIEKLEGIKKDVEQNKENIKFNNDIDLKVKYMDETIKVDNDVKDGLIREVERYGSDIRKCGEEIDKRKKIIEILEKEEKIIRNWNIYQELVGKNGIVKIVLRDALPVLNNEIARLLSGLCDFDVVIGVNDENKVTINMERNGQKLDMAVCASGFETVMASMAVRHSLASIASMSKANFTVYDEILDGVAVSNYDNVRELFERMVKSYDFILHITHNELISDWHTNIITVTKSEEGVSRIEMK